jgi:hypothetical protein
MRSRSGTSWLEALCGLVSFLGALVTPFLRARRRRWGATDNEIEATHPGDELVPDPNWTADHAIPIRATPQQVWPWIVQIGQGRGGFYSYERMENLAGCKIRNTTRILEEHQDLKAGDGIRLHADMPPMTAAVVDESKALVLHGDQTEEGSRATVSTTWAFLLLEQSDGTTRLLSRTRYRHGGNLASRLMGGPLLIEPLSFVMERKMLRVIKMLVESS